MARATCVKCDSNNFEVVENTPRTSNFNLLFVQCASCGGVVGGMDYFNIGSMLQKLATKLGAGNIA